MNKRLKFLGLDVLYSILLVIVAGICSLIQCIGIKQVLPDDQIFDPFMIDMRFNWFFYILGTLLFAAFLWYSFKKFMKTKYEDYPVRHAGVVILHFMISFVFCTAMMVVLIFASLIVLGFNKNPVPELLEFITVFVWPIASFILMNAALIVYIVRTKKEAGDADEPERKTKGKASNKKK